jgi:two-component system sensor histidine kinase CiaH
MASLYRKQKLAFITFVYWFLLIFIVAAWVWWFISLKKQNALMYDYRVEELKQDDISYAAKMKELEESHKGKNLQYISEGVTFLLVTLLGAVFVYRATRKQIVLSQQQQNFMMAVTHELKTPISVTRLNLETLQKRRLDEQQQHKLISTALQETNRLDGLTNNILIAAQLESGNYRLNKQPLNFSSLVNECVQGFTELFPYRTINKVIREDIHVEGELQLLRMLVNNLLDNGLKYSPKEKPVEVILKQSNSKVLLQVVDEGEGIADAEKKKIFEKFYRSGNEATRTSKGTGLGLYLCKRIVRDHKGNIIVKDNSPSGCVFTVTLQAI